MNVLLWLAGACLPVVQPVDSPKAPLSPVPAAPVVSTESPLLTPDCPAPTAGPRIWAEADTLLWWMKSAPLPPLVTRGSPADPISGAPGQPGTRVIYGNEGVSFGPQAGLRLNLGGWLDEDRSLGLEAGALYFGSQNGGEFSAGGDFLFLPSRTGAGLPSTYIVSDSVIGYSGSVNITNEIRFWGLEGNSLLNLYRGERASLTGIAGWRYLDLSEQLTVNTVSADTLFGGSTSTIDGFRTRNQFLGGQLGLQAALNEGRFFASLRTTVALGNTHQSRDLRGLNVGDAAPAGTFPHGYYVQASNTGRYTENDFSVVPQVGLKMGLELFPGLRLFAGYDFLYWGSVVRPGDQIDTSVNTTQSYGGTLIGPGRPAPISRSADFWAHGVNLGLQLRY